MISSFFTTSITVKRQSWSNDSSSQVVQTTFNGHIQPGVAKHYTENEAMTFTKPFTMWCDQAEDLKEGDIIDNTYSVKYIIPWNVVDNDDHLEVLMEKL